MTPEEAPQRRRFLRVLAFVWLGFISAFAVIDHVALTRLAEKVAAPRPTATEGSALQTRLSVLEQREAATREAIQAMNEARLPEQLQELDARLKPLQETMSRAASKDELTALADRLSALETRILRARAASPRAGTPRMPPANKKDTAPPFAILGAEWRGGERFLAVSSRAARSLAEVHLLRVGETLDDWQLQALEDRTAVFARSGRIERLHVP